MPRKRVFLTLDRWVVDEARQMARDESLSAFVNDILRVYIKNLHIRQLLVEMDDEVGPVPPEVREEVEREWREIDAWFIRRARSLA